MNDLKEEQTPQKKFDWSKLIPFIILILVISLGIIAFIYKFYYPHYPSSYFSTKCSGYLRSLGIIIWSYSQDHKGHYPQNLVRLKQLGYIEDLPVCPVSGKPYIYQVNGWDSPDFTVFCPNPEEHVGSSGPGSVTVSLYYVSGSGVNQVDK